MMLFCRNTVLTDFTKSSARVYMYIPTCTHTYMCVRVHVYTLAQHLRVWSNTCKYLATGTGAIAPGCSMPVLNSDHNHNIPLLSQLQPGQARLGLEIAQLLTLFSQGTLKGPKRSRKGQLNSALMTRSCCRVDSLQHMSCPILEWFILYRFMKRGEGATALAMISIQRAWPRRWINRHI